MPRRKKGNRQNNNNNTTTTKNTNNNNSGQANRNKKQPAVVGPVPSKPPSIDQLFLEFAEKQEEESQTIAVDDEERVIDEEGLTRLFKALNVDGDSRAGVLLAWRCQAN